MTAPMDYYALLGIPQKAAEADVRAAYKLQQRIWRKRAAATADGSVRGEATRRLALLDEALSVLSDQQRRAAYDRRPVPAIAPADMVATPDASTSTPSVAPSGDLVEQAEAYLAIGDYYSAARAARAATANLGNST